MNTFAKYATAAALVGALAVPAASPSLARGWHHHRAFGPGLGLGLAAGALVGAAAANAYAADYGPGYAYAPGYAYGPAYGSAYAYAPPAGAYYGGYSGWNEHACMQSPGSTTFVPCHNHN